VVERRAAREQAMDSNLLIWGFLFSTVGLGFFMYGKKQKALVPLGCGLALMIYPYFMPNAIVLVIVGLVLAALPYFIEL
jgi:hypothetical protein